MTISTAIKEAYARAGSSTTHRIALELRHYTWPSPARVIDHTEPVSLTLEAGAPANAGQTVTFSPVGMNVQEPKVGVEPASDMEIELDGVPGSFHSLFDAANSTGTPIDATIRAVALNGETVIGSFAPYHLQVKHVAVMLEKISVTLGRISPVNLKFPNDKYSPDKYPQLYK